MEFAAFADQVDEIEAESSDHGTVDGVSRLLEHAARTDPWDETPGESEERTGDLEVVARYVQGRVFPAWDARKLEVGPSACHEAIARAAGRNVDADDVEARLAAVGEIGTVAASYEFGGQQGLGAFTDGDGTDGLTIREVHETLVDLAAAEGSGSQDRKVDLLFGLFNRCTSTEARYLARLVLAEMRIGVGEGTVRDAVAAAFDVPDDRVERALQVANDYGRVARVAIEDGLEGLEAMTLSVGRPVKAMLAQAGTVTEAVESWEEAAVEWKYDGARVQLHHADDEVRVFSRNMEDVTDALPEVVEFADDRLDAPAILDGEVVAIDEAGDPLPFQEVLRRFRRKHDVAKAREDVTVEPVFFDCLHVDGEDLLETPLRDRHARLESLLAGGEGRSKLWLTDDPDEIDAIDAEALESGHEGIMLKDPDSTYSPGRRGKRWLKRKPDVETLDCVVTGAEWGEGRRATFLGTFELSIRDGEAYETIGKVATGITDEKLAELTALLEPHVRSQDGTSVDVEPAVVFEVGYEEIQSSPTYSSGYALRFPRFVGVREDLDPDDADTVERVRSLRET
ncbi:ATP-dependent DNA ligase LigA [Natrialbaceae archaeon AArc-T1-2]|uniref:ATP-dependent DNA ligase LigA n=1 Tax=Natrialbaceae archaeon AArc-T1-2 TaxID=3053904 RepID=UPI00255ABE6E|nr:ATP-dependent DNA ligase LigA [Natrialbaceae archaeon AArc-T1-2]WIV67398.1 ATP-dependent DNA ligase LigA [Natrialbaceae archaeon AArc-T1-2]